MPVWGLTGGLPALLARSVRTCAPPVPPEHLASIDPDRKMGRIGEIPMLGLPGNPVSSLVCALVYLRPAIMRMLDLPDDGGEIMSRARLGIELAANDQRQDYLRATCSSDEAGETVATPFGKQDSSMLSRLARADCLIIRAPHAPAAKAGDFVEIIRLAEIGGI